MPRQRPATTGYARLAQADDEHGLSDDSGDEGYTNTPLTTRYAAIQPGPREGMRTGAGTGTPRRPVRRSRTNSSGVDIKAINARLEKWAEEIVHKFRSTGKGKSGHDERLEIHHSVFQAPEGIHPLTQEELASYTDEGRMTKHQFDDVVESVRVAIELGTQPKMISKGSSGSYFARNGEGKVVGVFKPKDEEPYATRNPKWTKWVHRNLFPWFFGRACLIPNLSYVSEAAAYVLDTQLRINLVPYTDVVYLSSKSFYYDFWERRSTWSGKRSLPAKPGSFQVFLKGFKDANLFLREHPWPDQNVDFRPDMEHQRKRRPFANCIPGGQLSDDEDERSRVESPGPQEQQQRFHWTPKLKEAFREELEKLVILDYIMRNTDRGLDNWMIKIDQKTENVNIVIEPPQANGSLSAGHATPRGASPSPQRPESNTSRPYRRYEAMESRSGTPSNADFPSATIKLGAIDNSLSWPWKHPDAWRSYPFGWLFLPVSLIGLPFTERTRSHFLPLLTSTAWWSDTRLALRRVFTMDPDFKERMFDRQMAVMKGQAWNVVETLKQADHGPLELTRRARVCVWDDIVDVPVAIPMRAPSNETRMKKVRISQEQDEMDIGVGTSSGRYATAPASSQPVQPTQDLLGSPTSELPNPNRFELSREDSAADLGHIVDEPGLSVLGSGPMSPSSLNESNVRDYADMHAREARDSLGNVTTIHSRPKAHNKSRLSFDFSRSLPKPSASGGGGGGGVRGRPRSMSTKSNAFAFPRAGRDMTWEGDEEGDLGYAAASDMEASKRKVIMERLEMVKGRNPFFTWC